MSSDGPGKELFRVGQEVVLLEAVYGYASGTPGVVMRVGSRAVHVRFETTGHTLSVPRELLDAPPEAAADGG
jgi:hypothetical protein